MAYSKRQLVTALSVVLLSILTALASYALHLTRYYSLPIPTVLGALTVGLPAIAGLTLESAHQFRRQSSQVQAGKHRRQRGPYLNVAACVLLVLETAIATLAGTYIAPRAGLTCGLDDEWMRLFRAKNGKTIERIQNALSCCGLHSVKDKSFPFPSHDVGVGTCSARYDRHTSCFSGWRAEERKAASIILAVTVTVALWKILVVTDPLNRENASWLHEILPDRLGDRAESRRAIEYPDTQAGYEDDPEARASSDLAGAVPTVGASRSQDPPVTPTPASRVQPSGLGHGHAEGWGNVHEV